MPCPSRRLPGASAWSTSGPHYRPLINWLPLPPTRWSVPAVLVGGRALRVPPGWASGPPFPDLRQPALAGYGGLAGLGYPSNRSLQISDLSASLRRDARSGPGGADLPPPGGR